MTNITAIIVSYNRADLLKRSYESIRAFSDMPVIIIDGSSADNPCDEFARSLSDWNTKVLSLPKNIGHGNGMDMGIREALTDFVLLMDSDAEIRKGECIQLMMDQVKERVFGCGQVVTVNGDGTNVGEDNPDQIPYLHPHFAVISRTAYFKVPGFVHHGAPCIRTMQHSHTFKKYSLVDFPVAHYVNHDGRGTRSLNPEGFLNNWQ